MSEENTKNLTQDEKLDLILSRLTAVETQLMAVENGQVALENRQASLENRQASLEAKVDERLHDTRPMWQAIHAQTEMLVERVGRIEDSNMRIEEQLKTVNHQLEEMTLDVMEVRTAQ